MIWVMIRNIYLKFQVNPIKTFEGTVKNVQLHQNFNQNWGRGRVRRRRGEYDSSPYTSYSRAKKCKRIKS